MGVASFVESFSIFLQEKKSDFIPENEEGSRSLFFTLSAACGCPKEMGFP